VFSQAAHVFVPVEGGTVVTLKQRSHALKTTRSHKSSKDQALLTSLAESIGSTLGSIAAKVDAAQKALAKRNVAARIAQEGKRLVRKKKRISGGLKKIGPRGTRRGLRRPPTKRRRARTRRS
jgi:hypothetical protein